MENIIFGYNRWGHVKEQFDTEFYRKTSRDYLKPIILELKDYVKNDFRILAVVGIDGSPSCGVNLTCSAPNWGGEISSIENLQEVKKDLKYLYTSGVFMEELNDLLKNNNIYTKFIGYRRNKIEELIKELDNLI